MGCDDSWEGLQNDSRYESATSLGQMSGAQGGWMACERRLMNGDEAVGCENGSVSHTETWHALEVEIVSVTWIAHHVAERGDDNLCRVYRGVLGLGKVAYGSRTKEAYPRPSLRVPAVDDPPHVDGAYLFPCVDARILRVPRRASVLPPLESCRSPRVPEPSALSSALAFHG